MVSAKFFCNKRKLVLSAAVPLCLGDHFTPVGVIDPYVMLIAVNDERRELYRISLAHGHKARIEPVSGYLPPLWIALVCLPGRLEIITLGEILRIDGRRRELISRCPPFHFQSGHEDRMSGGSSGLAESPANQKKQR